MKRIITTTMSAAALCLIAVPAASAGSGNPGRKGTVAAYAPGPVQLLDSQRCHRRGKLTWDYVSCGKRLRARVKEQLCRARGKGTHRYFYQVGNGKKNRSSVYCASGSPAPDTDRAGGGHPGRKGSVAAFFPDRLEVFDSQRCHKKRLGYDYTGCGRVLRDRVKRRICARRGKGSHRYYYQVADGKKLRSSVYCKR